MIHLIVGNTGAGKTTYSNALKLTTKGIIFSIDTWNNTLFIPDKKPHDGIDWFLERIDRSEVLIMNLVKQLEESKIDTILDLGFSKFIHRQKFIDFATSNSFKISMHYLDVSKKTRLNRILQRNKDKGETFEFEVTKENFDFMEDWFEKPNNTELKKCIVINE